MKLGTATVLRADSRHLPLDDDSVDLVVTSPPYFALRSYQDGGEHYDGQIGAEPTPDEFVDSLLEVTRECVRVLKPSGSLWVNLGDSYYSGKGAPGQTTVDAKSAARTARREGGNALDGPSFGVQRKSLVGLPWRYALRCIDDLGLILRAEVIWSKPNGLPESVTDRVRRSHEQWFHFTLEPRYFSAVDEIREPTSDYRGTSWAERKAAGIPTRAGQQTTESMGTVLAANPLGKLPGSVWTVPTEPLRVPDHLGVDHFAAFPTEWPKRIIQGWSPAGVCVECGEGRRPVTHRKPMEWRPGPKANGYELDGTSRKVVSGTMLAAAETTIVGEACRCGHWTNDGRRLLKTTDGWLSHAGVEPAAPRTRPAVVLDPFGGTGTTAMVAKALGRHGITVDMSADYCRLAEWRTNDRDQLAKVLGIAKAEQPHDDEQSLLDLINEVTA